MYLLKKLFCCLVLSLCSFSMAYAMDSAKVRIEINGPNQAQGYFLCLSDVGCLNIRAGLEGKVYPVLDPISMSNIFVANAEDDMRLTDQGLPSSCKGTVDVNHTITIRGTLVAKKDGNTEVAGLSCSIS